MFMGISYRYHSDPRQLCRRRASKFLGAKNPTIPRQTA
jgi:hypothetical protein